MMTVTDPLPKKLLLIVSRPAMKARSKGKIIVNSLMEHCFPIKIVTRHTSDKPWITDLSRKLIRKRQSAYTSGNRDEYRVGLLRNMVNRESTKLKF